MIDYREKSLIKLYLVHLGGEAGDGGPLGVGIILGPTLDPPTPQLLHHRLNSERNIQTLSRSRHFSLAATAPDGRGPGADSGPGKMGSVQAPSKKGGSGSKK